MKPIVFDLFCGLGGWSDGFIAEGYHAIGFDIEKHDYGNGCYPGELVMADVLAMNGADLVKQFGIPAVIVASPPCQEYSYMAMPWSRAKAIAADYKSGKRDTKKLTALFDACFRIQREAIEAAGHFIPMVVENVRGAQPWVGKAKHHYGSYYLWGDVPALMPITRIAGQQAEGVKVQSEEGRRTDVVNGARFTSRDCGIENEKNTMVVGRSIVDSVVAEKVPLSQLPSQDGAARSDLPERSRYDGKENEGVKQHDSGRDWFAGEGTMSGKISSNSPKRKAASAAIAKIPLPLARWIAKVFKPR